MLPRLEDQDRLFINKFVYRFENIERGDVVVFNYPRDPEKSYIKRVIALPGDRLSVDSGPVSTSTASRSVSRMCPNGIALSARCRQWLSPEHEYFVMGDHRSISSDSRDFGPVARHFIYGKAEFVYWPSDQVGVVH